MYGPEQSAYEEGYEDMQVGLAIAKVAARLWYQRIPGLVVFGGSAECFQYAGKKGQVFDRRAGSVRRLANRILQTCWLQYSYRVVSGIKEVLPLRASVVDGIGHYGGNGSYWKLTTALAAFCIQAQSLGRSRL